MSREIFEGDEWKNAKPEPITLRQRSRAEQQAYMDDKFLRGELTRELWSRSFDRISMLSADGSPL